MSFLNVETQFINWKPVPSGGYDSAGISGTIQVANGSGGFLAGPATLATNARGNVLDLNPANPGADVLLHSSGANGLSLNSADSNLSISVSNTGAPQSITITNTTPNGNNTISSQNGMELSALNSMEIIQTASQNEILMNSSGTAVSALGNITITTVSGGITLSSVSNLELLETASSSEILLSSAGITLLPLGATGSANNVLTSNGSGVASWGNYYYGPQTTSFIALFVDSQNTSNIIMDGEVAYLTRMGYQVTITFQPDIAVSTLTNANSYLITTSTGGGGLVPTAWLPLHNTNNFFNCVIQPSGTNSSFITTDYLNIINNGLVQILGTQANGGLNLSGQYITFTGGSFTYECTHY